MWCFHDPCKVVGISPVLEKKNNVVVQKRTENKYIPIVLIYKNGRMEPSFCIPTSHPMSPQKGWVF